MATTTGGDYWSGQINFAGLGNGTDFPKLIDGLIQVEERHSKRLEAWKKTWEVKSTELANLNTKVRNLQTVLKTMDTAGELMGKNVSSSDAASVTASADGTARFGSHQVQVKQLAKSDHWVSTGVGFDKADSVITTSNTTFRFSYAGKSVSLNVPQNTTLKQFVDIINKHPELRGKVEASSISDGSKHFLKLSGVELGAANRIVVSNSGIPNLATAGFTNVQAAQDALLKVDGFPPGPDEWMSRTSNSVGDALTGINLNLKAAKPGTTVEVTVSHDTEKTKSTVKKFISALNDVRAQIKKLTQVSTKSKDVQGSILTGNYGVELVSQNLRQTVSGRVQGFYGSGEGGSDVFLSLAAIGIITDADKGSVTAGQLKLLDKDFDKALKEDPEKIVEMFVVDHSTSTTSSDFSVGAVIKGVTEPGKHEVKYTVSGGKITSATIGGKEASVSGWSITGKQPNPGGGMSINVNNQADGTYAGSVTVKQGKIHELLDEVRVMTSTQDGTLKIIEKNYKTIIESIDKKLEREKKRLTDKRRHLKLKFSRLDTTLGRYDRLNAMMRSQIAKLGE